jgi:hypothetical protein
MVGKTEGRRYLRRPRRRWELNNEMGFKETECGVLEWIQLAQNRVQWRALVNIVSQERGIS